MSPALLALLFHLPVCELQQVPAADSSSILFSIPLHRHAQQVVLTPDLLHSSLSSLLATSDTIQLYRLFGNTLSHKVFT